MRSKYLDLTLRVISITLVMAMASIVYSQDKEASVGSGEFDGVEVINPETGFLKITNNWKLEKRDIFEDKYYLPYGIYDSNGTLFKEVSGSRLGPQTVNLPEGTYFIKYSNSKGKVVKFGVQIQDGKTTLIE